MIAHFNTKYRHFFNHLVENLNLQPFANNSQRYISNITQYPLQSNSVSISHSISADNALQMIQNLRKNKKLKTMKNRKCVVNEAFEIFNAIDSNHISRYLLNAMMQLLSDCQMSKQMLEMYEFHSSINDHISHMLALKACVNCKNIKLAHIIIQQNIIKDQKDVQYLPLKSSTTLIHFYGIHCSDINSSETIFDSIPIQRRDTVIINAMMKVLTFNGKSEQALQLYEEYEHFNDMVSHVFAIKACISNGNIEYGKKIIQHKILLKKENINQHSIQLLNTLIDFYGVHCLDINTAQEIFNEIPSQKRNTITFNSMMKALTFNGMSEQALQLYENIEFNDNISDVLAIKACISNGNIDYGKNIIQSFKDTNKLSIELLNTLIDFYGVHCSDVSYAWEIFNAVPSRKRNAININSMMKVLIVNGMEEQALLLYKEYEQFNDNVTHMLAIQACMTTDKIESAQNIIRLRINLDNNHCIELLNTLIDFYGLYCLDIKSARKIFDRISVQKRDAVTVGAMMKVLIFNGKSEQALQVYEENEPFNNNMSHVLAIKACVINGKIECAKDIIELKIDFNFENVNDYSIELLTTLIDFHGVHCLDINSAEEIFHSISVQKRNTIAINALMNAYRVNYLNVECLEMFDTFFCSTGDLFADNFTFVIALQACTQGTALHIGRKIHKMISSEILNDFQVQVSLICMYGKCGELDECTEIFAEIKAKHFGQYCHAIELFHAMMNACAKNGAISQIMEVWNGMKSETSLVSNAQTYCILFTACSHAGDAEQARIVFHTICANDIKYDDFVRSSFVDVISRVGCLDEALDSILEYEQYSQKTKSEPCYPPMWMALLGGCRKYQNKEMSFIVYNHIQERFGESSTLMAGASVLMANTFASNAEFESAQQIGEHMKELR